MSKQTSSNVSNWSEYPKAGSNRHSHQIDVTDSRVTNGQLAAEIGELDGKPDNFIGVLLEVTHDPIEGKGDAPAIHVNDGEDLVFSLFKVGDRLFLRPEVGVRLIAASEGGFWVEPEKEEI